MRAPSAYEILWDIVCLVQMIVLSVNTYFTSKQGEQIKKLEELTTKDLNGGGKRNA